MEHERETMTLWLTVRVQGPVMEASRTEQS